MQLMRYINLFARITRVPTTKVPKAQVSIAIGKGAVNVKKLNSILGKKIRVVAMPGVDTFSNEEIGKFVEAVVSPVEFNKIEVRENSIVINAGRQNKAALIGRGRQREKELSEVLKNFFKNLFLLISSIRFSIFFLTKDYIFIK